MENLKASLIANITSVMLFSPVDLIKTNLTVYNKKNQNIKCFMKKLYKKEGIKGFYKGFGINLATIPISNSIYMTVYEQTKYNLQSLNCQQKQIISSIFSGIISNFLTNPLWLLKSRMQICQNDDKKNKLINNIQNIYKYEGIQGFYKGLGTSLFGLLHLAIYYPMYEYTKIQLNQNTNYSQNLSVLIASLTAKFTATLITYPNNLFTTKLQCMSKSYKIFDLIKIIYQEAGCMGFYQGIQIDLMRSLPSTALTFCLFESMKIQKQLN